jgi:superfamily II DNA or RNA helicase
MCGKATAKAIAQRMYTSPSVPGVILGDEVGMGKTYVALALAAALSVNRKPRILILAHSREMAHIWCARWDKLVGANPQLRLPQGYEAYSLDRIGAGVWFGA